jgi:hypothetical protein
VSRTGWWFTNRCAHIANGNVLSLIAKILERPRNPDLSAPEGTFFTSSARLWIKRTRSMVWPRGNALRLPSAAKLLRVACGQIAEN